MKERELRTQQLMEVRKKRQEKLDRLREEKQQRKIQELNKQFYMAKLERERRRQHTAVVKALEARKRYEEREKRLREDEGGEVGGA